MAQKEKLSREEIIEKIISKREFSELPKKDVELVYSFFEGKGLVQEELIKSTRDLLRKMYTAFVSSKLLNIKDKDPEWFLKKHISTKERFGNYVEVYSRIFSGFDEIPFRLDASQNTETHPTLPNRKGISRKIKEEINVYDLGNGINGFSYDFFPLHVNYFGFEAVGQLVDLQNKYFEKEKKSAICVRGSLFDLDEVKKFLKKGKGKKIIFLFKTLDSLEMLKRNYSKKLLFGIVPLVDRIVVSFATKSLGGKLSFYAKRVWLKKFIEENFKIIDEFEAGIEKYIVFGKK